MKQNWKESHLHFLLFKEGEWLSIFKIKKTVRLLYATRYFILASFRINFIDFARRTYIILKYYPKYSFPKPSIRNTLTLQRDRDWPYRQYHWLQGTHHLRQIYHCDRLRLQNEEIKIIRRCLQKIIMFENVCRAITCGNINSSLVRRRITFLSLSFIYRCPLIVRYGTHHRSPTNWNFYFIIHYVYIALVISYRHTYGNIFRKLKCVQLGILRTQRPTFVNFLLRSRRSDRRRERVSSRRRHVDEFWIRVNNENVFTYRKNESIIAKIHQETRENERITYHYGAFWYDCCIL